MGSIMADTIRHITYFRSCLLNLHFTALCTNDEVPESVQCALLGQFDAFCRFVEICSS